MKTAYFGISKSNRVHFDKEIEALKTCLRNYALELYVFVDEYNFNPGEEKVMMAKAFEEIDRSEFLIAELSKKAIGVGIEVGYAFAKEKPIVYIKRKGVNHSTTVDGCSNHIIEYENVQHLMDEIDKFMNTLI